MQNNNHGKTVDARSPKTVIPVWFQQVVFRLGIVQTLRDLPSPLDAA